MNPLVCAAEYTDDDLLNTIRILGPFWACLIEPLVALDHDQNMRILAAITAQQAVLDQFAVAVDLPPELLRLELVDDHDFSLAASLLRKRNLADRRTEMETAVDASMELWTSTAAIVRSLRAPSLTDSPNGSVMGLFSSDGGVPKVSTLFASVGPRGFAGDRQASRNHHGRAWQALCIWSAEVVESLASDGHPISPGSAGENISVAGLHWSDIVPGTLLSIGTVVAEVTGYALPCSKNSQWFNDRNFERIHHRSPGNRSRVYASVVATGDLSVGDAVAMIQ